jgi:hypothetical protein
MSNKFEEFKTALVALCKEHSVCLGCSGYDSLQVWDDLEDCDVLYSGIDDKTLRDGVLNISCK